MGDLGPGDDNDSGYFDRQKKRAPTEAIAKWMIARSYATGHGDTVDDLLAELEGQARERGVEYARQQIRAYRERQKAKGEGEV